MEPELVAHDLHPDYLSTEHAVEGRDLPTVGVQHHHAHLAACLAEHGEEGPAVGVIFDGTGYRPDGTVWGGEILIGGLGGYERVGSLWPVRLPGAEEKGLIVDRARRMYVWVVRRRFVRWLIGV